MFNYDEIIKILTSEKNKKYTYLLLTMATASSLVIGAHSYQQNRCLSQVGNYKIRYKDIERQIEIEKDRLEREGHDMSKDELKQYLQSYQNTILETVETEKILEIKATELDIVSLDDSFDSNVNNSMENLKSSFVKEEDYKKYLKENRMSKKSLYNALKNELIYSKICNYYLDNETASEDEILKYYNDNILNYSKAPGGDLYNIVVKTEEEANAIYNRLENGEDFNTIASEVNINISKDMNGYVGPYFKNNSVEDYYAELKNTLDSLEEKEYTKPIETIYGYHIFKVENLVKEETPFDFEDVKFSIEIDVKNSKATSKLNSDLEAWRESLVKRK